MVRGSWYIGLPGRFSESRETENSWWKRGASSSSSFSAQRRKKDVFRWRKQRKNIFVPQWSTAAASGAIMEAVKIWISNSLNEEASRKIFSVETAGQDLLLSWVLLRVLIRAAEWASSPEESPPAEWKHWNLSPLHHGIWILKIGWKAFSLF